MIKVRCQTIAIGEAPPIPDTTFPTVAITAPGGGATVSSTIPVTANASDNVGVVGVQFKLDGGNLQSEDTTPPYSISWDTTGALNGSHSLTATARDAAGNATTSATVNVTVSNGGGSCVDSCFGQPNGTVCDFYGDDSCSGTCVFNLCGASVPPVTPLKLVATTTSNPGAFDAITGLAADLSYIYAVGYQNSGDWRIEKRNQSDLSLVSAATSNPGGTDSANAIAIDGSYMYVVGTQNGVDFRAAASTPVKAALDGIIVGVGDTDRVCPGASYGKWVLIKHANGLSTVYAHLSLSKAITGETVKTGQVIAYSGNSGYSTGPHLHLTVYATQGARVGEYAFKSCAGAKITMPLISVDAYLDPLIYL